MKEGESMATASSIEWTDNTWNPVSGCTRVSPGCRHCYAERMAMRLQAMGLEAYRNGFKVTLQPQALEVPLRWRQPRTIFVNSMSDLYHREVPETYVQQIFAIMAKATWHRFQILTKRSERLVELAPRLAWPDHIWQGVTVENTDFCHRIDHLRLVPAAVRFLSLEPLLGPLPKLDLTGIHWVIVGGESGPGARPMRAEWALDLRDQCVRAGVPFFFKQWGGVHKKAAGRLLAGRIWDEMPELAAV
jgi:protein gp37